MTLRRQFEEWVGYEKVPRVPRGAFVGVRMGFFDIESTELQGRVGQMLCGCVADSFGRVITVDSSEKRYYNGDPLDDSLAVKAFRDLLETFDIIAGWNSGGFDLPFLNARLTKANLKPVRSEVMHRDLMWLAGGQSRWSIKAGRRSLANISAFYKVPHQKTELDWEMWERARRGDGRAHKLIVEHCQADALLTRDVYAHLKPLIQNFHR